MKLIHHNILDGCEGDEDRKHAIGRWLKGQSAGIVTLNELNGWHRDEGLALFGQRWGWDHSAIAKAAHREYAAGILSTLSPLDADEHMRSGIRPIARIGRGAAVSMLSDHHPVLAQWPATSIPID
jgi:hypothetical protein